MQTPKARSIDPASIEMLSVVGDRNLTVAWDRYDAQQPQCGFGQLGLCCRNCTMGPCRIDPFGDGPSEGICGATAGCTAIADAKAGLLCPEAAANSAGKGLQEICEAVGIPPVLHLGACVDISRILIILSNMVAEGGLGTSIADLPAAAAAPEWMSEKAVAIGFYAAASGAFTVLGEPFPVQGAPNLTKYLTQDMEAAFGGKFAFESDPVKAARLMIDHLDAKRAALHLPGPMYEVPYVPKTAKAA